MRGGYLALAERPVARDEQPEALRSDLQVPGWQDFTEARDRFFAGLARLAAEGPDDDEAPRPEGRAA